MGRYKSVKRRASKYRYHTRRMKGGSAELVSVVIPTYNRFKYLLETIQSIKGQTYPSIEIIVVNDKSTQPEYYSYDFGTDVKLINLKSNSREVYGYACAAHVRNEGIKAANGKWVAFCDDDDVWLPKKLELQIAALKESGCKMSCTDGYIGEGTYNPKHSYKLYNAEFYLPKLREIFQKRGSELLARGFPKIWNSELLEIHNCVITSSVVIAKEVLDTIGNFKMLNRAEDYDCWKRATKHTDIVYVEKPCFYYDNGHGDGQQYGGNKSKRYRKTRLHQRGTHLRKDIIKYRGGFTNNIKDKVIFCKLHGGLGNRIFIYAASLVLKDLLGMKIILINGDNIHSKVDYTPFFKQGEPVAITEVQNRFDNAVRLPEQIGKNSSEFMSKLAEYKKTDVKLEDLYYHNFKLVEPVIHTIKLDFVSELESRYPDFKKSILNGTSEDKMIFMHVRKGDFDSHGWSSSAEYFKSALDVVGDTPDIVHVISNDVPYCKEQIAKGIWNSKKIRIFEDLDELKAMYLMTLCKGGAIISKSTFSWWGAMLGANDKPNSIILYPEDALNTTENKVTFPEQV